MFVCKLVSIRGLLEPFLPWVQELTDPFSFFAPSAVKTSTALFDCVLPSMRKKNSTIKAAAVNVRGCRGGKERRGHRRKRRRRQEKEADMVVESDSFKKLHVTLHREMCISVCFLG